jgi:hypothetical protein
MTSCRTRLISCPLKLRILGINTNTQDGKLRTNKEIACYTVDQEHHFKKKNF